MHILSIKSDSNSDFITCLIKIGMNQRSNRSHFIWQVTLFPYITDKIYKNNISNIKNCYCYISSFHSAAIPSAKIHYWLYGTVGQATVTSDKPSLGTMLAVCLHPEATFVPWIIVTNVIRRQSRSDKWKKLLYFKGVQMPQGDRHNSLPTPRTRSGANAYMKNAGKGYWFSHQP